VKKLGKGVIGAKEINTGVNTKSMSCPQTMNEIVLYRQEDWFKVFIHESIHSYQLDFESAGKSLLHSLHWNLSSDVNVFEAYTECWATLLNALLCSFAYSQTWSQTLSMFTYFINLEIRFGMYQMNKVLHHMGLTYTELTTKRATSLYQEDSNVLSYFVLKPLLMVHFNAFLDLCAKHNPTWMQSTSQPTALLHALPIFAKSHLVNEYMECVKVKGDKRLQETMKMCLLEWVF
jgi:hypothetical protein